MFKLFKNIQKMFTAQKAQNKTTLDKFIESKNPKTLADVEFWVKQADGGHYGRHL